MGEATTRGGAKRIEGRQAIRDSKKLAELLEDLRTGGSGRSLLRRQAEETGGNGSRSGREDCGGRGPGTGRPGRSRPA